jgi:DNA polymerase III psi subunit
MFSCAGMLIGQETPKGDVFLGYSFTRYQSVMQLPWLTANGGLGGFALNFSNHVAGEAQLGGWYDGSTRQYQSTTFNYLFGPRISWGRSKKVDPYIHVLFGGQTAWNSVGVNSSLVPNPQAALTPQQLANFQSMGLTPQQVSQLTNQQINQLATANLAPFFALGLTPQQVSQLTPQQINQFATGTSVNRYHTQQNAFAMVAGLGLDYKIGRRFTFRPFQFDWVRSKFAPINTMIPDDFIGTASKYTNSWRYAGGIVFNFGLEQPVTTKTCPDGSVVPIDQPCPNLNMNVSLNTSEGAVCPGTVVKVSPAAGLPAGAMLEWSVNGQPVSHDPTFDFATANQPAGQYRIGLKATKAGYNDGTAETTVTIKDYQPPSGTVTASPAEIWVGDKSTLSANFTAGQCGGPLQPPQFTASEGTVTDSTFDSSSISFDPSDNSEQRKTITITAKVSDGKGIGSADTQIVVKRKANIVAKRFPDILFTENSARVNNCGKRLLLEELKSQTDADPTGTVYFVGHMAPGEKVGGLDLKRAENAAAVISAGKGICTAFPASQIYVSGDGTNQTADFQPYFCGTSAGVTERRGEAVRQNDDQAKLRRVEVWFVPTNGKPPETAKNPQTAASAGVAALGCPR